MPAVAANLRGRQKGVEALAAFAEELAKPIAGLAAFMTGEIGTFWLVAKALELVARSRAAGLLRPERAEDFEQVAAERISAAWAEGEERLAFKAALDRVTQAQRKRRRRGPRARA